ncbi:MAG: response regulator [Rubrivivax sp.]|nr:response regulator [Rubrivivax sp.]
MEPTGDPVLAPFADPRALPPAVQPPRFPRVLVVDDNPVNLELASALLSELGAGPVLAGDGAAAVALALELSPDLVLMDLQMPVLDGVEAARQIRRLEREHGRTRMPILAFTATRVDTQRLMDYGFDGLLLKPCEEPELLKCLQRWCTSAGPLIERAAGAG